MKWCVYIEQIVMSAGRTIGSLCRDRQLFSLENILKIYKYNICPSIYYCCYILSVDPGIYLEIFDKVQ